MPRCAPGGQLAGVVHVHFERCNPGKVRGDGERNASLVVASLATYLATYLFVE